MVSHATRLFNERDQTVGALRSAGVDPRYLFEWDDLIQLRDARLARLAQSGIATSRWQHLRSCTGDNCSSGRCGAACVFAERYEIDDLNVRAFHLLKKLGMPLHFSTIVDPNYSREPGNLDTLSLNGMRQSIKTRLRAFPADWGNVRAIGAVEVSLDRSHDGRLFWSPHVHLIVSANTTPPEITGAMQPRRAHDPELVGRAFRPVKTKPVTNLANGLSYSMKMSLSTRAANIDPRGNTHRHPFDAGADEVEKDIWLLAQQPRDRIILRKMKVTRGGLTLLH